MTLRPVTAAASLPFPLAITCTQTEASTTAVSNFGNSGVNATELFNFSPAATSFTTGPAPSVLSSVTAQVTNFDPTFPDTFAVAIWSDDGGHPGAPLEPYPGQSAGHTLTTVLTYTSPAGLPLAPDTTYWAVLTFSNPLGPDVGGGRWDTSNSPAQTSPYGWTIADFALVRLNLGSGPTWTTIGTDPDPGLLSIDATILPEPSTFALTTLPALALLRRRRRHSPRPAW